MPSDTGLSIPAAANSAAAHPSKMNGFAAGATVMPVVPRSLAEVAMVAAAMIKAGLVPDGYDAPGASENERYDKTKARLMIGIMKGAEVGLPPIAALSAIAMIDNRPTIWGDGAVALVQRSGVVVKIESGFEGMPAVEGDAVEDHRGSRHPRPRLTDFPPGLTAVYRIWRKGQAVPYEGRFSVQDAMRAHLWGNLQRRVWIEYPKRMLMARARAYALRDGFADCLMGLSIREEIEDLPADAPGKTDTSFLDDPPLPSAQPGSGSPATPRRGSRAEPVREAMPPRAPGAERRATAPAEQPLRSPLWDMPIYELSVGKNTRGHPDWRKLYDDLLRLIGEAASEAELERLESDNKHAIEQIGVSVPHGREVLDQAFASRVSAIRGE